MKKLFIFKGSLGGCMKFIAVKIVTLCFSIFLLFSCQPQLVKEDMSLKFEFSKSKLNFYTASKNGNVATNRVYNKSFNKSLTDYIWYELYVERNLINSNFQPVSIVEKWSKSLNDSKIILSQKTRGLYLLKDSHNFEFTAGFKPDLGYDKGLYLLEIMYDNHILVKKNFTIK